MLTVLSVVFREHWSAPTPGRVVLALNDAALAIRLAAWRKQQTDAVAERPEGAK